jgi:PHD/YefM family antitoxin component YafN of YafNO toxin-antitoxin module
MTAVVAATEFCRNFATYQRRVQREPIQVRSHDKVTGYYISAEDYARVERILAASRQAYHPGELPPRLMAAIRDARMSPEHDHLNALTDDDKTDNE